MDLTVTGELGLLFSGYPQSSLWWAEIIIGVVLPIFLFSLPGVRQSRTALFWSAVLVVLGLVLNRFNVSMLALGMRPDFTYVPHWMEVAISVGLIADAILVIQLANRLLPIVHYKATDKIVPGQIVSSMSQAYE
jgi:Ni/Fe-hydrogenase subunit HybB-like protein